jgi:hypothetical protein
MKQIELTLEHKEKLLEMCNEFFPEYPWGFGQFYSTEIGAKYKGLDYLDITHLNHKIPCIVPRYELEHENIDTSNLKVIEKGGGLYDKLEYGFVNNFEPIKQGFTINYKTDKNGNYDYTKPIIKQYESYDETYVEGIHWFEFLMCKLIPKFKSFGINIDYWLMTLPSTHIQWNGTKVNHPVDYIYNEFKKLKNAK